MQLAAQKVVQVLEELRSQEQAIVESDLCYSEIELALSFEVKVGFEVFQAEVRVLVKVEELVKVMVLYTVGLEKSQGQSVAQVPKQVDYFADELSQLVHFSVIDFEAFSFDLDRQSIKLQLEKHL